MVGAIGVFVMLVGSLGSPGPVGSAADLARPVRKPALLVLYSSFAALDALDIHSTLRAIGNGAVEANPAMRGVVSSKASFIAMKAATGGIVIFMAEKVRKRHPKLAIGLMAGLNSVMAIVVAHNYSLH